MTLAVTSAATAGNSGGSSSISVTLPTVNAGDIIVVFPSALGVFGGTLVDTAGLSWTSRTHIADATNRLTELWWAVSPGALTNDVITRAYGAGAIFTAIEAISISGANTTTPFPNASYTGTNAGNPSMSGVTTTNANSILLAASTGQGSGPLTAESGWTAEINASSAAPVGGAQYKIVSAIQSSITVTMTNGASSSSFIVDAVQTAASSGNNGSLNATIADFTLAGTGSAAAHGSLNATIADFTVIGTGHVPSGNNGELNATIADFTLAGTGSAAAHGSLNATIADFTLVGSGEGPARVFLLGPSVRYQIPPFGGGLAGGGFLVKPGVGLWALLFLAIIAGIFLWSNK